MKCLRLKKIAKLLISYYLVNINQSCKIKRFVMRSFLVMIIFGIIFITFLFIVMNFVGKKDSDFSSNINGNVSGREGTTQTLSPIGIVNGIVGIK